MKTYCTQNNGLCSSCSLSSYGRDCLNIEIDDSIIDECGNDAELTALVAAGREALTRIETNRDIILDNLSTHAKIIEALESLAATRVTPII